MSNDKPLPEAVREQIVREVETVVGHDLTCESQTAGCMCDFELRAIDMATALEKIARVAWEAAAQQERARLADETHRLVPHYSGPLSVEFWRQVNATDDLTLYTFGCSLQEIENRVLAALASHPPPTPEAR